MGYLRSGRNAAVHLVVRSVRDGMDTEIEGGVCPECVPDAAAVQLQRVRGDADAVCIDIVRLHLVAKEQANSVAMDPEEGSEACLTAHVECQPGASGDFDPAVELDPSLNRLARSVGGAVRGAVVYPHMGYLRSSRNAAVHLVVRGVCDGTGAEIEVGIRPECVPDAAAVQRQRIRRDANAVCIQIVRLYRVPEQQDSPATTAPSERSKAHLAAHIDCQSGAACDLDLLVESDPKVNRLARPVGRAVRRPAAPTNPHPIHLRSGYNAAVHLVVRSVCDGTRAEIEVGVRPECVPDAAAVQLQRVRSDADAVCIDIVRLHLVAKVRGIPIGTDCPEGSEARPTAHIERQPGFAVHLYRDVKSDPNVDCLPCAVGDAVRGAAGNPHMGYLWSGRNAAVHLLVRSSARRWPSKHKSRSCTVSGLDAAAVQRQRIGCDVDAIRVAVLPLHQVAEFQARVAVRANTPRSVAGPNYPSRLVPHTEIQRWIPRHLNGIGKAYDGSDLLACSIAVTGLRLAIDGHGVQPLASQPAAGAGNDHQCYWNLDACLGPAGLPLTAGGLQYSQRGPVGVLSQSGRVRRDENLFQAASRAGPFLRVGRQPARV